MSIEEVRTRVIKLSSERLRRAKEGPIALTERQMQIVEYINQTGKITIGEVSKMFKITRQAALKEVSKLVNQDVVELRGKRRGAHYVLA